MIFGMPVLIEIKTLEACAALCHELGFSFIELNMNLPEYQTEKLDIAELADISAKYDIFYTIHLDENLSPCDFNVRVAEAWTKTVLQTIETAKQLAVPILNMHLNSGVWFTMPNKKVFLFDEYEEEYLQRLEVFRDNCTLAIGGADIKICVENSGGYRPVLEKGLQLLLKSPVFALTFDIGHNAGIGGDDEPVIMRHSERLVHMHVHDADFKGKNHLALGTGELDLPRYFELAQKLNCCCVLEVKTVAGLRQSAKWLKGLSDIAEAVLKD